MNRTLERTLRRYVLSDLPEGSRIDLEERLVREPELFEALGIVEQELIDEYLDATLSPDTRAKFERHFLTARESRRRLDFNRALREYASTAISSLEEPVRPSWVTALSMGHRAWAAACAALMAALVGTSVWFATSKGALQQEVLRLESQQRAERERSAAVPEPPSPTSRAAGPVAAPYPSASEPARNMFAQRVLDPVAAPTFALTAGVLRGAGDLARVTVPAGAQIVGLRLMVSGARHATYRVVLHDADGEELWSQSKLNLDASADAAITIAVPAQALPAGDYQIRLEGGRDRQSLEPMATYSFRVTGAP